MSSEELWSGVPLTGIAIVLLLFGVSEAVRAVRHDQYTWPLSWGKLSALFLFSLAVVAAIGAFSALSDSTPESYELRAIQFSLWGAFAVHLWTAKRWRKNDTGKGGEGEGDGQ